jgi:hypothetical protein
MSIIRKAQLPTSTRVSRIKWEDGNPDKSIAQEVRFKVDMFVAKAEIIRPEKDLLNKQEPVPTVEREGKREMRWKTPRVTSREAKTIRQ